MNWVSLALFLFKKIRKTRQLNLIQIQLCWFKLTLKQWTDLAKPFNCSWPHYFLSPFPPSLTGCPIVSLGIEVRFTGWQIQRLLFCPFAPFPDLKNNRRGDGCREKPQRALFCWFFSQHPCRMLMLYCEFFWKKWEYKPIDSLQLHRTALFWDSVNIQLPCKLSHLILLDLFSSFFPCSP